MSSLKINIGCGKSPTNGWINCDNSFSIYLAKYGKLATILHAFNFLKDDQYSYIKFLRENKIRFVNATEKLPFNDNEVDAIYSSHMLEHLSFNDAQKFLQEAFRVLHVGGVLRIAVPSLTKRIAQYNESGDADEFIDSLYIVSKKKVTAIERFAELVFGKRNHQWMYDEKSLIKLFKFARFGNIKILNPGQTGIKDSKNLDLYERQSDSIYCEATKLEE